MRKWFSQRFAVAVVLTALMVFSVGVVWADESVTVSFYVVVPERTPTDEPIYIGANFNGWDPGGTLLEHIGENVWRLDMDFPEQTNVQYKYTRGDWERVEKGPLKEEISNRTFTATDRGDGRMVIVDYVPTWRDEERKDEIVGIQQTYSQISPEDLGVVDLGPDIIKYPGAVYVDKLPPLVVHHEVQPVKNVILFIGDGMSSSQLALARTAFQGANSLLAVERMPVVGLVNTHNHRDLVTGSAAAGTQLATGYWTVDPQIGLDAEGNPVMTILELAKTLGKSTGLVATSRITHATPASFAARVRDRDAEVDIATNIFEADVDVVIGGGRRYFLPTERGGERGDGRNLLEEAEKKGYAVLDSFGDMIVDTSERIYALLGASHLPEAGLRDYALRDLTEQALERLSLNENGFFIMIEGSQIDWAGHDNDGLRIVRETLDMDEAVEAALAFAGQRNDTLVLVTADHETGGLSIVGGNAGDVRPAIRWIHTDHSGVPVPIYAFGPNAELFGHHLFHCDIPALIARGWGVENFGEEREVIEYYLSPYYPFLRLDHSVAN